MSIDGALSALEATSLAGSIRNSLYLFPFLESLHVVGLTMVFGTIAVLDLRMLGIASTRRPVSRIALARALYGKPFLVVLDEPNSNLDAEGDIALTGAVQSVRRRGGIVIVVAHRPVGIEGVDMLLMMKDGRVQAFGPKEQVLGQVLQRGGATQPPIKIVSDAGAKS